MNGFFLLLNPSKCSTSLSLPRKKHSNIRQSASYSNTRLPKDTIKHEDKKRGFRVLTSFRLPLDIWGPVGGELGPE